MVGKKAFFISDRSGFRFPLDQRVREPGTNLIVAKSESDGIFNLVTNPQNKVQFPVDKEFIRDARPPDICRAPAGALQISLGMLPPQSGKTRQANGILYKVD